MTTRTAVITFSDSELTLDARAALFWPREKTLVVSDLHLQKGRALRRFAHPLPDYDTVDTLRRLSTLIEVYQPLRVICLGDSFHDTHSGANLPPGQCEEINRLCESVSHWSWIIGNHDPDIPEMLAGERYDVLSIAGICFSHEPLDRNTPQINGHFHPKTTLRIGNENLRGKCFLSNDSILLMPAFGTFTGGLDITHEAITSYVNKTKRKVHFIYNQKIWPM